LDVISCTLHKEGHGTNKKHAAVISVDHEQVFWDKGMLGYSEPRILQRAVFFYVGLLIMTYEEWMNSTVLYQNNSPDIHQKALYTTQMFTTNTLNLFQKTISIATRMSA